MPAAKEGLQGVRVASDLGSCKDSFRYRVVEESGRYRFDSVYAVGDVPCAGDVLEGLLALINGAWLDEIDPAQIEALSCGRDGGCSRALAELVGELKEVLMH